MAPSGKDRVRLLHMLDAAGKAVAFTSGKTREDLGSDELLALALVRLLEVIGEASKGVSEELREQHPDIEWKAIAATRDRLIHGYYDIDQEIVWRIVTVDLVSLIDGLKLIPGLEES